MSNTFQLNKVYSNENFRQLRGMRVRDSLNFYINLYKDHPEDCPWPKAREEYRKHIKGWENNMVNYIIPVKRTKCFLIFSTIYGGTNKKKIRIAADGNEYIIIDNVAIYADNLMKYTPDEAKYISDNEKAVRGHHMRYTEKLMHLEEYGYVYLSNLKRVESIEELNAAFGV